MIKFFLAAFFLLFSTIGAKDLSVAAESDYISPNFDGFRDTVKFRIDFDRDIKIKNWIFTLTDESGKPVRSFRADLRHKRRRNFLFYLFSAETELTPLDIELPEFIEWSGNDPDGKILPDGKYNYQVTVYQENSLEKKSPERSIYLDSNFPKSEVKTDSRFFSPNKDKFQDILNLKQSAKGASDDRWQGVFYNYKGVPVKSYFWDSKSVPANFNWDGRDESGNQLENGLYRYRLTGEDKAGNRSVAELAWIVLNQDQIGIDIQPSNYSFSPDGDGNLDFVNFSITIPPKFRYSSYRFSIYQKNKDREETRKEFLGHSTFPENLSWDGKDTEGNALKDGEYFFKLELGSESFSVFSYEKIISLNSKRLKVNLDIDPDDFTPDGDGDDDLLEIFVNVRNSSVNVWELTLYETGLSGSSPRRKIKVWKGDRNPAERIVWDGHGDDTLPIGSLAKLELEFTYEDEMKNIGTKRFNNFQTGVLVTDSDGTLHIAIPEILVKESESSIIRKIRSLLKLYPGYKMEVQSHSAQAGKDLENLSKTEARAKRLFKLIFGKEFPEEKYRYRGYGEVEPQLNLQNEYSEEKNNRIEVVFKK